MKIMIFHEKSQKNCDFSENLWLSRNIVRADDDVQGHFMELIRRNCGSWTEDTNLINGPKFF